MSSPASLRHFRQGTEVRERLLAAGARKEKFEAGSLEPFLIGVRGRVGGLLNQKERGVVDAVKVHRNFHFSPFFLQISEGSKPCREKDSDPRKERGRP